MGMENQKVSIGILGAGALSKVFLQYLPQVPHLHLLGIYSRTFEKTQDLAIRFNTKAFETLEKLLEEKPCYLIEFAGIKALQAYAESILSSGSHLIGVSVGAYADPVFFNHLKKLAHEHHTHIYIPTGAIGGLDVLQSFSLLDHTQLTIESTKSPKSLNGAPYLNGKEIDDSEKRTIFEGSVSEAIAGFPKNVNVAVAASLASGAPTQVRIVSDPTKKESVHKISVASPYWRSEMRFSATPTKENPKSSPSAALSVLSLLKNLTSDIRFF